MCREWVTDNFLMKSCSSLFFCFMPSFAWGGGTLCRGSRGGELVGMFEIVGRCRAVRMEVFGVVGGSSKGEVMRRVD